MDSERPPSALDERFRISALAGKSSIQASRVKLYPSCAATHPTLDALLHLAPRAAFTGEDVEAIDVEVDSMTPTVLIHDRPATGLEAKFSMPFCAAAAVVHGYVGIDTFDAPSLRTRIHGVLPRVTMRVDPAFDAQRRR